MSWEIITEIQAANYARVSLPTLQDIWYDVALGLVEEHTGWTSLTAAQDYTEYVDGSGSALLIPNIPINTVTTVQISGVDLPAAYYYAAWNGIQIRSYKPGENFQTTVFLERTTSFGEVFPYGIKNIYLSYNAGGTSSLPAKRLNAVKGAMLMIIKEFSTVPRNEGSDSMLKKYRPDRTLLPEEVLTSYGVHGKINGILNAMLPREKVFI